MPRAKVSCQAGPAAQFSSCSLVMLFHGAACISNPLSSESAFLWVARRSTVRGSKSPGFEARIRGGGQRKQGLQMASSPENVSPASLLHCKVSLDSCLQYSNKNLNSFFLDGIRTWSAVSLSPAFILTHELVQVTRPHKTRIKVCYIIII